MSSRASPLRVLLGLGAGVLTAACSQSAGVTRSTSPTPVVAAQAGARPVAGGCGSTQVYQGGLPSWVEPTVHALRNMDGLPYAVAGPSPVAGFIFAYPLKADGTPQKILWVVGVPRNGAPLDIEAHPSGSPEPLVTASRSADSGPGDIYPDGIGVPSAGCWHITLTWASAHAELDLHYS